MSLVRELLLTHLVTILGFAFAMILVSRMLRDENRPSVSIAWMLAIFFVPYLGVPAYLLFGGRKLAKQVRRKGTLELALKKNWDSGHPYAEIEAVLTTGGMPPARGGNAIGFIGNGEEAYRELCATLERAQWSIHIEIFIFGRDEVGQSIVDLLARKAAQGVQVRVLLDALGCFRSRGRFFDPLRTAGGKVGVFMPVLPLRRKWSANLRNHRKLIVIDGRESIIGGMNIAREYMGPHVDPARWLDTAAVVHGPLAADMDALFAIDWKFATGETLDPVPAGVASDQFAAGGAEAFSQLAVSGPDVEDDLLYDAILSAIHDARERVWIVTPYFIPDEGILKALVLQARLGRDVRIVLPHTSNHFLTDVARGRFVRILASAGARIFLYSGAMVHAKHVLVDHAVATVGSLNFDIRSFYLNYEAAIFVYSRPDIDRIAQWVSGLMDRSMEPRKLEVSPLREMAEDLCVLISPLL